MAGPTDRQVSILETQSKTSGFSQSTAEAKALDQVFDDVTASSKRVSAAQIDTAGALGRAQAKYSEVARVAQEVARMEDLVARSRAQNRGTEEQYADILSGVYAKQEAVLQRAAAAADKNTTALERMKTAQLAAAQAAELQANMQDRASSFAGVKADVGATTVGRAADIAAYGNALDDLKAKYNPLFAAQRQFMAQTDELDHALKVGAINIREHGAALDTMKAGYQRSAAAVAAGGAAALSMGTKFGLASHQVTNLGFQLNDLAVQIASGGGILLPLVQQGAQVYQILQMGEGGVGGVLKRVGSVLAGIGPLGWAAFGLVGLAGAVGVSTVALALHGAKLAENEARLAAFSSRSSEIIAVSQRLAVTLGVSATGGFQALADATIRWGTALGIINVESWITNFGRLAQSGHATAASADAAAAAFAKLASQGTMTVGQLVEFVDKFPQFAQAIANALGVSRDQLKKLETDITVSSKTVATAIANAGAAAKDNTRPWNQLTASIGNYIDKTAALISADIDATLDNLAKGIMAVVDAWKAAVDWIGKYIDKMLQLAGIKIDTPAAPSGGGGTAPDSGGRTTWKQMVDAMNENAKSTERTADNTESQPDIAKNTGETVRSIGTLASSSAFGHPAAFGDSIADANAQAFGSLDQMNNPPIVNGMGKVGQGATGTGIQIPWEVMVDQRTYGTDVKKVYEETTAAQALMAGKSFYEAAQFAQKGSEIFSEAMRAGDDIGAATKKANDALNELATAGNDAAKAMESIDLGQLGAPIQTKIDSLRSLQETALSRTYRPDPYAEKNPDFFYSGERIFKEQQDKVYEGLQVQITKLEGLQTTLAQLVNQGEAFPSAIVNAMVAAGFGDIASQIVTAFRSSPGAPASATPAPTAVQTPMFSPTSSSSTPTPTKTTGTSFNSLSGWSNMYGV